MSNSKNVRNNKTAWGRNRRLWAGSLSLVFAMCLTGIALIVSGALVGAAPLPELQAGEDAFVSSSVDPIWIRNHVELMNIGNEAMLNQDGKFMLKDGYYKLYNDITIPGGTWEPFSHLIDGIHGEFTGMFNGGFRTIYFEEGATITSPSAATNWGIIGRSGNGAVISNLNIYVPQSTTLNRTSFGAGGVGVVVGHAVATRIENIQVMGQGSLIRNGGPNTGGVVGIAATGSIIRGVSSSINVTGLGAGITATGGVAGRSAHIFDSFSTGNVTGGSQVGGLVGDMQAGSATRNHAAGDVQGVDLVGGLMGIGRNVSNSFSTGNVTGNVNVGGLSGRAMGQDFRNWASGDVVGTNRVGGYAGETVAANIHGSASFGNVTLTGSGTVGTPSIGGGFIGHESSISTFPYSRNNLSAGNVTVTAESGHVVLGGFIGKQIQSINGQGLSQSTPVVWARNAVYSVVNPVPAGLSATVGRITGFIDNGAMNFAVDMRDWTVVNENANQHDFGSVPAGITIINNPIINAGRDAFLIGGSFNGWNMDDWIFSGEEFPRPNSTPSNPIGEAQRHYISTAEQLSAIGSGEIHNGFVFGQNDTYVLAHDIIITQNSGWMPASRTSILEDSFGGRLYGAGHTITLQGNFVFTGANTGIIGRAFGATIQNLILNIPYGSSMQGANFTGGILGHGTSVVVTDVAVTGRGEIRGTGDVGGVIGFGGGVFNYISTTVDVRGSLDNIGGVIGTDESFVMANSWASGNVYGRFRVGGFVGNLTNTQIITDNAAFGNVTGDGVVGGFAGAGRARIENSLALGDVTVRLSRPVAAITVGNAPVNGVAGAFIGMTNNIGANMNVIISRNYAYGNVISLATSGFVNLGGFVGVVTTNTAHQQNTLTLESNMSMTRQITTNGATAVVGGVIASRIGNVVILNGTLTAFNQDLRHVVLDEGVQVSSTVVSAGLADESLASHNSVATVNPHLMITSTLAQMRSQEFVTSDQMGWDLTANGPWIIDPTVSLLWITGESHNPVRNRDNYVGIPMLRIMHPIYGNFVLLDYVIGGETIRLPRPLRSSSAPAVPSASEMEGHTIRGWYTQPVGGQRIFNADGTVYDTDLINRLFTARRGTIFTFHAQFDINRFNVYFENADGSIFSTQNLAWNTVAGVPTNNPILENYAFDFWSVDGVTPFDFDTRITSTLTLVPVFTTFRLIFNFGSVHNTSIQSLGHWLPHSGSWGLMGLWEQDRGAQLSYIRTRYGLELLGWFTNPLHAQMAHLVCTTTGEPIYEPDFAPNGSLEFDYAGQEVVLHAGWIRHEDGIYSPPHSDAPMGPGPEVEEASGLPMLSPPTNIFLVNENGQNIVTWRPVASATAYRIYLDGWPVVRVSTATNPYRVQTNGQSIAWFNLDSLVVPESIFRVTIRALGDGETYADSRRSLTYEIFISGAQGGDIYPEYNLPPNWADEENEPGDDGYFEYPSRIEHTVAFINNGDIIHSETIEHLGFVTAVPNISQIGYTLLWRIGSANGEIFDPSATITQSKEIFAVWTGNIGTIRFTNAHGNASAPSDITVQTGVPVPSIPQSEIEAMARLGWSLDGFRDEVSGIMVFGSNGTLITGAMFNIITPGNPVFDLVAVWSYVGVTVQFVDDGLYNGLIEISATYIEETNTWTISESSIPVPYTRHGFNFGGWYGLDINNITEGKVVHAIWNPVTWTVIFEINDGTDRTFVDTFVHGAIAVQPANPVHEDYENWSFMHWATRTAPGIYTPFIFATTNITNNITLFAVWSQDRVQVTFHGIDGAEYSTITIAMNGHINLSSVPYIPARIGHALEWRIGSAAGTAFDFGNAVDGNISLFAHWVVLGFEITFRDDLLNAGEVTVSAIYNPSNGTWFINDVSVPNITEIRDGYVFGGWNMAFNINDIRESATVYAIWHRIFTLTFEMQDGSTREFTVIAGGIMTQSEIESLGTLVAPEGFVNPRWVVRGSEILWSDSAPVHMDKVIFVMMDRAPIVISFEDHYNVELYAPTVIEWGGEFTLLEAGERYGYTFGGWQLVDGEIYAIGHVFTGVETNKTFVAIWNAIPRTVTFENHYEPSLDAIVPHGTMITLPQVEIMRAGYQFGGWIMNSAGNAIAAGTQVTITADTVFAAMWAESFVTISFLNHENGPQNATVGIGLSFTIPLVVPTQFGYTFGGWYRGGVTFNPGHTFENVSSGKALTAVWNAVYVTVIVDNNYENGAINQSEIRYGSSFVLPSAPIRYGYEFGGWRLVGGEIWNGGATVAEVTTNMTFQAIWIVSVPPTPTPTPEPPMPTLSSPENLEISEDGMLTWDSVAYAEYFRIYIDGIYMASITGLNFDLSELIDMENGENIVVSIVAMAYGFYDSAASEIIFNEVPDGEIVYARPSLNLDWRLFALGAGAVLALFGLMILLLSKSRKRTQDEEVDALNLA